MFRSSRDTTGSDTINVAPTEDTIYATVAGWLKTFLPSDYEIFTGIYSGEPSQNPRSILVTFTEKRLYATCSETDTNDGKSRIIQPILATLRLEIYRDGAGDAASLISTLWRQGHAGLWFKQSLPKVSASGSSDCQRKDRVGDTGEHVETWVLDLTLDVQSSTLLSSESALALHSAIIAADNIDNNKDSIHG